MTQDPLLIVEHIKTVASALVDKLNRNAASGLIDREILILTGELQQALCAVGGHDLIAVPSIEWLQWMEQQKIVNGGQMSEEHRAMVLAMHEGRHYEPAEEAAE